MSSPAGTEFQKRLGAAIQQRGLSLARIRDRLGQQGMAVSIATLIHWTSGRSRPTRASSLEIMRAREIMLGTEPGWLVAEIPGPSHAHPLSDVMQRKELLAAAVEEHGLRTSADWRTLSVRHSACIDAAGCELDTPVSRGDQVLVGERIGLFGTRHSTFGVAHALKANGHAQHHPGLTAPVMVKPRSRSRCA